MGVKGMNLRSDGLHKQYGNGNPADTNRATLGKHGGPSGGNVSIGNSLGKNKQFGNHMPEERGTPGTSPYAQTGAKSRKISQE